MFREKFKCWTATTNIAKDGIAPTEQLALAAQASTVKFSLTLVITAEGRRSQRDGSPRALE